MIKKIISLVIAVSTVLSLFVLPVNSAVQNADFNLEECELLYKLKIIDSVPEGDYIKKELTRAEFAIYLSNILVGINTDSKQVFYDVPTNHYAFDAISKLYSLNIISASDDGMFRPDDSITTNEAIKLTVELLGYGEYAKENGGYPAGYIKVANSARLSNSSSNILYDTDAFKLLFNACITRLYDGVSYIKDSNEYLVGYEVAEDTLFSRYFNLYKTTASVTYASGINILNGDTYENDTVIADGIKYTAKIDLEEQLGRRTTFFYIKENDEDVPVIIHKIAYSGKENIQDISSDDFVSFDGSEISYYKNNKLVKEKIPENIIVIKNGSICKESNTDAFGSFTNGTVRLVGSEEGGRYKYAFINQYVNFVVDKVDITEKIIYDNLDKAKKINVDENKRTVIIKSASGAMLGLENINSGMLLSVYESENYVKIIVCGEPLTGKIFEISREKDKVYLTIGKAEADRQKLQIEKAYCDEYVLGLNETVPYKIEAGAEVTYYKDVSGKIAYIKKGIPDGDWVVGYLYRHALNYGMSESIDIKVFSQNGICETLRISEKAVFDGATVKGIKNQLNCLNKVVSYNKSLDADEDVINGQIIRYKKNGKNEICEIDTERIDSTNEGRYCLHRTEEVLDLDYIWTPRTFNGHFVRTDSTISFHVPSHSELSSAEDRDFFVANNSWFIEAKYRVEGFKLDKNNVAEDVICIYNTFEKTKFSIPYLVKSVREEVNKDGDIVKSATMYMLTNGAEREFTATLKNDFNEVDDNGTETGFYAENGDVIRIQTEPSGEVSAVKILYDYSRRNDPEYIDALPFGELVTDQYGATNLYYVYGLIRGYIKRKDNNACSILYRKPDAMDYQADQIGKADFTTRLQSGVSFIYHNSDSSVEVTYDDILLSAEAVGLENAEPYILIAPEGCVSGAVVYREN